MSQAPDPRTPGSFRVYVALIAGLVIGGLAGTGVVFHDGRSLTEGLMTGAAFFGFGFALFYWRVARRLAEFLSSLP